MKLFGIEIGASRDEYFEMDMALKQFGSVQALAERLDTLQKVADGGIHGIKLSSPPGESDLKIRLTIDGRQIDREGAAQWLNEKGVQV